MYLHIPYSKISNISTYVVMFILVVEISFICVEFKCVNVMKVEKIREGRRKSGVADDG